MAKVVVPVRDLQYAVSFSNDAFDVLQTAVGYNPNEDFTFTFRITVEDEVERERLRGELRAVLGEEAEALIATLDAEHWDVSFFCDTF